MSSLRPARGRFSQKSSCAALTTPVIYPLLQPQQRVTKLRAFSSGGERFPDTEEVTSSNLVTPTTKSAPRRSPPAGAFCCACKPRRAIRPRPQWHSLAPVPNGTHPMVYSRREARLGPKAPQIPGVWQQSPAVPRYLWQGQTEQGLPRVTKRFSPVSRPRQPCVRRETPSLRARSILVSLFRRPPDAP